uniref:CCHC-type domain-containing protein n=1 Tax=Tanacetum cinerariifolium TaxID=118510 RepID=A0A6L2LLR3_TANCI|nr:hypothetical protein [Tanacetum cinerariifolium]
MILESVENGPLIWPTVEENGVTRTKKYAELSVAEKIQADCDMKATNIILQVENGLLIWPTVEENEVTRTKKYVELFVAEKIQADCDMKATNIILQGDDPIACLNKAMPFLTIVVSLRFPSTNNQLRTSSNLRNQATIQDGRITVQQVHGRQGQSYFGTGYKSNATSSGKNNASGQTRVVKCYNCQGKGHMARQCTQPKRPRNAAWYKDKATLAGAQCNTPIFDIATEANLGYYFMNQQS